MIMAALKKKKTKKKAVKKIAKKPPKKKISPRKAVRSAKSAKKIKKASASQTKSKKILSYKPKKILRKRRRTPLDLYKPAGNPIITPSSHLSWESKATFNPTALYHDGAVHIIYRAIGDNDMSVLGYAKSADGITIDERFPHAVYFQKRHKSTRNVLPKLNYSSGGGWGGGCEDPRLTLIGDTVYMLYTAFDGWGSLRIGLTSINLEDFLAKRFLWEEPVMISPPGEIHKNWVLFPEKIHGKYAILHALSPEVMVSYIDSMDELDGTKFINSIHQGSPLWYKRDNLVRGVGPAPILTKYGWLVLYHAMDELDPGKYKLWAMLLDKDDPTKVLHRSFRPILEPDEHYENNGFKSGVVYSCGAVVKDGTLFVYYGGADTVACVATANLDAFLKELVSQKPPILLKQKKIKA